MGSVIQEVNVVFIIVDKPDELRVAANHAVSTPHFEQRHRQDSLLVSTENLVDRQVRKLGSGVPWPSIRRLPLVLGGRADQPSGIVIVDKNALAMLGGMILGDDLLMIVDFEHRFVAVCLARGIGDREGTCRGNE